MQIASRIIASLLGWFYEDLLSTEQQQSSQRKTLPLLIKCLRVLPCASSLQVPAAVYSIIF